jgi:hypothetical protein
MAKAMALGLIYALDGIYTLEVLGLEKFPMTASGKVRKNELKKIVLEHRKSLAAVDSKNAPETIRSTGSSISERSALKDLTDATSFR